MNVTMNVFLNLSNQAASAWIYLIRLHAYLNKVSSDWLLPIFDKPEFSLGSVLQCMSFTKNFAVFGSKTLIFFTTVWDIINRSVLSSKYNFDGLGLHVHVK